MLELRLTHPRDRRLLLLGRHALELRLALLRPDEALEVGRRARVGERDEGVAPFEKSVGWLNAGQAIAIVTPGSGGYGPPENRDPELVKRDLREGRISPTVAQNIYGIDVD